MIILLSPAKKMQREEDILPKKQPVFLNQAEEIKAALTSLTPTERRKLWKCSEKLAAENEAVLAGMDFSRNPSPALFSYVGLAYQYLSPESLEEDSLSYLENHLRILSGLYGVLRPEDGIVPYRLEMGASLSVKGSKDLYSYWNTKLAEEIGKEDGPVVSLASKEYEKAVLPYLNPLRVVEIIFMDKTAKGMVTKGTFAKMARGEMTRWMAENEITEIEDLKSFSSGYQYLEQESDPHHLVFLKTKNQ